MATLRETIQSEIDAIQVEDGSLQFGDWLDRVATELKTTFDRFLSAVEKYFS